jgi:hypothetical protein
MQTDGRLDRHEDSNSRFSQSCKCAFKKVFFRKFLSGKHFTCKKHIFQYEACCNAFSFGYLPGVQVLKADVSELSVGSIFIGRSMKCDRDWSVRDIYTGPGSGKPERSQ